MRNWSQATISWILAVLILLVPGLFAQDCQVVFILNPPLSNLTLGGAVTKPLTSPFTSFNPDIVSGLQGEYVASLPAPCPTDAAGLQAVLVTAKLSTTPATGLIELYPSQISVKAGDLATLQFTNVAFNSTLQLATASNQATLNMTIAQGFTNSTSIVTPAGDKIDLVGVTASNTTQAAITTEGSKVTITLTNVVMTLNSEYTSYFAGQPLQGGADYVLSGSIVMQTVVGCNESCGPNGRCATAEDGTVGCQCECGWSGAGCALPSGFCPRYPGDGSVAAICPVNPPPAPAPVPAPVPSGGGGGSGGCGAAQCSTWQNWDATSGTCQCKDGFDGPGCDACKDDAACSTYFSTATGKDVSATCSTSRLYSSSTVYKAYKCQVDASSGLSGVEPGTFTVGCNTTTGSFSGDGTSGSTISVSEGSFCEVHLALEGRTDNPITCKSSLCAFQSNSSRVNCQSTTCQCRTACPDLDGVFDKLKNQPAVIDCDDAGICVFDIKNFFVTLKAPCTNHECLVEGYVMQEGAFTDDPSDSDWTPLIAAIPLIALVAAACVFSFYLLTNRAFFKSASLETLKTADGSAAKAAAVSSQGAQIVDSVREIAFSDINKIVPIRGSEPRAILSHVSGVARMGELVGIVGPSGGGKTSLLSVLAGSVEDSGRNAIITGSVTLDGSPLDASLARRVAYCAQDCTLLPTLSVEECVRYSALLRLPRGTSAPEVATVVSNVINELGLTKVAASLVGGGSGIRGVSGGERRRITIAMELVTNPAILMLDEPTSGLDSFTAYNMMSTLKTVANSGRIVMLSFHQPSPAMFNLLDRCFLMAQGRCVFSGAPKAVEAHFAGIGLPVPAGVGAAEHMLHCACDPASLPTLLSSIESVHQNEDISKTLETTAIPMAASNSSSEDAEAGVLVNGAAPIATSSITATALSSSPAASGAGLSRQLAVLFWRALMDIVRNPTLLLLHWVMGLIMGLFGGCIFFDVGLDISGAQDRLGAIFFSLAFFAFTSLTTVDLIMNERRIVSREVRGGYYSPAAYYVTKAVLDALLLRAIPVLLYSAPFYPMIGFIGGANHVGLFLMVLATFAVVIGALSLAIAVGSTTPGQASLVMNIILLISLLVGGFFVNAASMPVWISWLRFISAFFYAYAALTINEFSSLLLNFEVEGYTAVQNVRGTTFLDIVGINYNRLTDYVIVLDCMYAIFLLLGFALLYYRMPRQRRLKRAAVKAIKK